jgi:plasmanylethanolamine desaturase
LIISAGALALGLFAESLGLIVFLFSLVSFVSITNQIHKMAHSEETSKIFDWISRFGLVLSKTHHENHHGGDQTKAYCITIGLWNPLLDRIGFFFWLESVIKKITGLRPRNYLEQ